MTSPGTKSSYPLPPQSLNPSEVSPLVRFYLERMMLDAWLLATLADVKRGGVAAWVYDSITSYGVQAG